MLPCCCQARSTDSFKTQSVEKKGIVITLPSQQRTNSYLTFWLLIILLSLLIACDGKEYRKDLLPGSVFCFPDTPGNLKGPRSYRDCPRGTLKLTYTESIPQLHGLTCILTCFFISYLHRLNLVDSLHLLVLVPISKFRNHWAFSNRPIYSKAFYFTPSPCFPTRIHKLHRLPLKKIKPNINTLWICRLTRIEPGATQTTDSSVAMQPHEPTNQYWSAVHTSKIWPAIATSVFLYILGVVHRVSPSWRSVHERAWLICCSCCPAAALSGFCGCFVLSLWRAVCSVGIASRDVGSRVGLGCVSCSAVGGTSWFAGVCFVYYVGFVCCYVALNNLGTSNPSSDHVEAFM